MRPVLARVLGAALALIACAAITPSAQSPPAPSSARRDVSTSARAGDLPGIAGAVATGAAVNGVDPNFQQTALTAASGGSTDAVRLLAKERAAVDAPDADTEMPLGVAMGHGQVAATEVLLASGADARAGPHPRSRPMSHRGDRLELIGAIEAGGGCEW